MSPTRPFSWVGLPLILLSLVMLIWFLSNLSKPVDGTTINIPLNPNLGQVLAPFVAVALAIERFWESVFAVYESLILSGTRFLTVGWMKTDLDKAQKEVTTAASGGNHASEVPEAEARLVDAQTRVAESLKAPDYVAMKRAITLLGSLVIGLALSTAFKLGLLKAAGFTGVAANVDIAVTGLLIGAGPGPLHSVITALQEFRNTLAGLADLARGSAIKKAVEAIKTPAAGGGPAVVVTPPSAGDAGDGTAAVLPAGGMAVAVAAGAGGTPTPTTPAEDLRVLREAQRLLRHR